MSGNKIITILGLLLFLSCTETPTDPEFEEIIVVNAYLYVGHKVDSLFVKKSLWLDQIYSAETAALSADSVFISDNIKTYRLSEYPHNTGVYYSDSLIITSGNTYNLSLHMGEIIVSSSTTAPSQIHISGTNTDTTHFLDQNRPFALFWNPADGAKGYIISTTTQSMDSVSLGDADRLIDEDNEFAYSRVINIPVNEYETTFILPWFMFWYYGEYNALLYAIDQNLMDLATSQALFGQSSEFEQPNYNIENGIGIFAAVSVDSVRLFVKPQVTTSMPENR